MFTSNCCSNYVLIETGRARAIIESEQCKFAADARLVLVFLSFLVTSDKKLVNARSAIRPSKTKVKWANARRDRAQCRCWIPGNFLTTLRHVRQISPSRLTSYTCKELASISKNKSYIIIVRMYFRYFRTGS